MRIAAIVLAHTQEKLLNVLINQLTEELDAEIFLHISKKSNLREENIISTNNIHVAPFRIEPVWAGFSLMETILKMFEYISSQGAFDYVLVLSGQDLIVKKGFYDFLNENMHNIFMDAYMDDRGQGARLKYNWPKFFFKPIKRKINPLRITRRLLLEIYSLRIPFNRKKGSELLDGLVLYKNMFWMGLPYDAMLYIIDYAHNNPNVIDLYKSSICPEESFFATILMNNEKYREMFKKNGKNKIVSLTYCKEFEGESHPFLGMRDVENIEKSGCYMARKFNIDIDDTVVKYYGDRRKEG